jgi:MFS family permease
VAVGVGAFQAVNWAVLSRAIPTGEGAQFFGLANIATAGASALAGLLGPFIDAANALLSVDAYHTTSPSGSRRWSPEPVSCRCAACLPDAANEGS